jgi:hypothetical protein
VPDPNPLEIERRAALVRATWDPVTRMKRAGLLPEDVETTVPLVRMLGLPGRHRAHQQ